jgi:tagatose-1,6-bisphosphate aldolase
VAGDSWMNAIPNPVPVRSFVAGFVEKTQESKAYFQKFLANETNMPLIIISSEAAQKENEN